MGSAIKIFIESNQYTTFTYWLLKDYLITKYLLTPYQQPIDYIQTSMIFFTIAISTWRYPPYVLIFNPFGLLVLFYYHYLYYFEKIPLNWQGFFFSYYNIIPKFKVLLLRGECTTIFRHFITLNLIRSNYFSLVQNSFL